MAPPAWWYHSSTLPTRWTCRFPRRHYQPGAYVATEFEHTPPFLGPISLHRLEPRSHWFRVTRRDLVNVPARNSASFIIELNSNENGRFRWGTLGARRRRVPRVDAVLATRFHKLFFVCPLLTKFLSGQVPFINERKWIGMNGCDWRGTANESGTVKVGASFIFARNGTRTGADGNSSTWGRFFCENG